MEMCKTLQVTLPLISGYENALLNILPAEVDVSLCLREGEYRITTEPMEVGGLKQFDKSPIVVQLTIWYEYKASDSILILCGDDLVSPDSMRMTISAGNEIQNTRQFTHQNPANQQEVGDGILDSPLTFGLQEQIAEGLRQANAMIIEKAQEMGLVVLLRTALPELSEDAYQRMSPVYHNGAFVEFFDPDKTYGPEYTIKGLRSIFGGIKTFNQNQDFANVIGSTHDPHGDKEYNTWIGLWEGKTGRSATICSSSGFPESISCNTKKCDIIGGHVIFGQKAQSVAKGGVVYIIPICKRHNAYNKCYMHPVSNQEACWMKNYFES